MKKTKICVILAVLLVLAGIGGVVANHFWYRNNHIFVEDAVYKKDLTQLDLRGTGLSLEHYESVRQQLPDCEIRYDLPFQGEFYADDTRELTITSLTAEEAELLDYLPELERIRAEGCRDYSVLTSLKQRRPELEITYTVELFGKEYPHDTKELKFDGKKRDIQELKDQLPWLPAMESIFFDQPAVPAADLISLQEAFPDIKVSWEKDAFGITYSSDITEIDLTGMRMDTPDVIVEELKYFPALEKVILSECGPSEKQWIDNETMAAFREKMRPEYTVVWTVRINNMKVRTDETYFMPSKYHQVVTNYQVQNLKYCEEMVCVDLGHMAISNISFVEGMPHLKYFIVMDAPLMYIDSISTCKELVYLEFFRTWINDFTPLLGCTALEDVNVSRTNGNPLVFKDMPWLKNLWIDGFDIRPSKRPELEAALPNTFIKYCDGELTANGWRDLPNYFAMRDYLGMPYNRW